MIQVSTRVASLTAVKPPRVIKPLLPSTERRSYQAAWRVLHAMDTFNCDGLAVKSTRRAKLVDRIAEVIRQEL